MDNEWRDRTDARLTSVENDVKALTGIKNFIAGVGTIVALVVGAFASWIASHLSFK